MSYVTYYSLIINLQVLPTKHIILIFNNSTLPTKIKVLYINCFVRPYIVNSLHCFKWQGYGYNKATRRGSVIWVRCAEVGRNNKNCKMLNFVRTVNVITLHFQNLALLGTWKIHPNQKNYSTSLLIRSLNTCWNHNPICWSFIG